MQKKKWNDLKSFLEWKKEQTRSDKKIEEICEAIQKLMQIKMEILLEIRDYVKAKKAKIQ